MIFILTDMECFVVFRCHCGEILTEHAGLSNSQPMNNVQRDIVEAYLIPESEY